MNENDKQNEMESLLCDYLDGQLTRAQRKQLDRRLEGDEPLREQLGKYAALDGMLGDLAGRQIEGVDYEQQRAEIVAAAERKVLLGQKPRRRVLFFRPLPVGLAAAASVLLLVGVAFWLLDRSDVGGMAPGPSPSASAVSVRIVPASVAAAGEPAVVQMKLAQPIGPVMPSTAAAGRSVPRGTVVVSSGAAGPRKPESPDPMMVY